METKFYFIHCVVKDDFIKKHILDTIFGTMTEVIVEGSSLLECVGALYTWYAVYFTEPMQHWAKIRLTVEMYKIVEEFHKELRKCGHVHADYVLCRLKSFSAFLVCVFPGKLCMGQQGEQVNHQLDMMREQSHVAPQSELMLSLRSCQSMLSEYQSQKEALQDHLPIHVLNNSAIDKLLLPSRLQALNVPTGTEEDKHEEEEVEEVDMEEDEPVSRRVLREAYFSEPGIYKRRK